MRPWWKPSAGAAFFACASLLVVLLVGNGMAVEEATVTSTSFADIERGPNGTMVLVPLFSVPNGSVIRIQGHGGGFVEKFELYVVEGGQGEAFKEGRVPEDVILHLPRAPQLHEVLEVTRPPPPAHLPSTYRGGSFHGRDVDVVWVDRNATRTCDVASDACEGLDNTLITSVVQLRGHARVVVLDPSVDRAQSVYYALEGAAVAGILVSGLAVVAGAWRRRRRADAAARPAPDSAEGMMDLLARTERLLATLRNVLASVGVLLAFLAFFGLMTLEEIAHYYDHLKPSVLWHDLLLAGYLVAFVAVALGWLVALAAAQRELMRFRRAMKARPPLER